MVRKTKETLLYIDSSANEPTCVSSVSQDFFSDRTLGRKRVIRNRLYELFCYNTWSSKVVPAVCSPSPHPSHLVEALSTSALQLSVRTDGLRRVEVRLGVPGPRESVAVGDVGLPVARLEVEVERESVRASHRRQTNDAADARSVAAHDVSAVALGRQPEVLVVGTICAQVVHVHLEFVGVLLLAQDRPGPEEDRQRPRRPHRCAKSYAERRTGTTSCAVSDPPVLTSHPSLGGLMHMTKGGAGAGIRGLH